ncbi:MAG: DUF2785 domain-containing protein [Erysipelotrichaceae bacterium]|nr:DUF2785 domain-containing protein [Erysipelotrichaceae bacterium]
MNEELISELEQQLNRTDEIASWSLLETLYVHIGDLDPILRDQTVYRGWRRLFNENRIAEHDKSTLLTMILQKADLFDGISDPSTDKVFKRSFTALLCVIMLDDQRRMGWMNAEQERALIETGIAYLSAEKDNRGYVPDKGWAHAFAHGADLLQALAQSPLLTQHQQHRLLWAVSRAFVEIDDFLYGEESRIAVGVIRLCQRTDFDWSSFLCWLKKTAQQVSDHEDFNICWKNFLLSFSRILTFEQLNMDDVQQFITDELYRFYQTYRIV